ncbi:MAG: hypothetical protein GWP17_02090 [Aquificales bacterium]|nr:hypothetical protein [Aquificales bacterium]
MRCGAPRMNENGAQARRLHTADGDVRAPFTQVNLLALWLIFSLIILWGGFVIRLNNLGHDSFWIDEILTVRGSNAGLINTWNGSSVHPPLLYVLVHFFIETFGENEFTVRLLSLFAGTLGIALLIQLGKSLRQSWVGLWAAILLVFSPYHLHYSQDARHYALLMATSLLSYIFLTWVFKRPRWRYWLFYSLAVVLNLYTHHGALLVLATQAMMIVVWGIVQLRNGRYRQLLYPIISAGIVVLLYAPMYTKLSIALNLNVGEDAVLDTGAAVPIMVWAKTALRSFNLSGSLMYTIMISLAIMGIIIWLWRRQWFPVMYTLSALCLPIILIQIFEVGRGANARYIIYTYPFYLLLVAIVPTGLLFLIYHKWGTIGFAATTVGIGIGIALISWPHVQSGYAYMSEDWRGISEYLSDGTDEPDMLLGISLSFANGFNSVSTSLPYYLAQTDQKYLFLASGQLTPKKIKALPQTKANIQSVISNFHSPMPTDSDDIVIKEFQSFLYVLQNPQTEVGTIGELIALYDLLLPLAKEPLPRCLLHQDLAALYAADEDFWAAYQEWQNATALCPIPKNSKINNIRSEVLQAIVDGLMLELEQISLAANETKIHEIADFVLAYDSKHEGALDMITFADLQELFETNQAMIVEEQVPEPSEIRMFIMPQSGDGREVIFAHPPTAVSFPLQLPDKPVSLHTALALDPQSWGWGGDGVTFVIQVDTLNGETIEIYRQHLANDETGHSWHDIQISLNDYLEQDIMLTLSTESGPAGDATGDWAGWASPRILWEAP